MEKSIEVTGKSIEDAIANALAQLKMERDDISVEVVEKPKSGFLGLTRTPARIRVTYKAPDEPKPAKAAVKAETPAASPEKKAEKAESFAPSADSSAKKAPFSKTEPLKTRETPVTADVVLAENRTERARVFIEQLLDYLNITAQIDITQAQDGNLNIELTGDHMGILIGRRGDMLDAVQHITGYVANRGESSLVRVTVDTENYRRKREEALVHLAEKTAQKVIKYRRSISLEPMNSYARHTIHAALQDTPDVTTFSTGTEPNRRIVVALARTDGRPPYTPRTDGRYTPRTDSRPPLRANRSDDPKNK